ncbi:MAG: serine/threonine-protein kinase [Kofleriaceae bacterium]
MTLAPGTVLGHRYRLESELGAGGMGTVYRGSDLQLSRDVAIKVMAPWVMEREGAIERFEREARVGAQLSHPHIVQTLDFGRADAGAYLVLQLVLGGDLLAYRTRQPPLSIATVCRIAHQLADALVAAHAVGVVHRDLKPENILLAATSELHVQIADFGMAFLEHAVDPRDGRLTRDGAIGGTPLYMAPEMIGEQNVGPAVDVYALGCIVFELLVGSPPFDGSIGAILAKQMYAPFPPLRELRPDTPPILAELVERMLGKRSASRPPADAVRHRLAMLACDEPSHARSADPSPKREARMVSRQADSYEDGPFESSDDRQIGLIGTLDAELGTALRVAGFQVGDPPIAWIAIDQPIRRIAELVATGLPVIADSARDDFTRVAELIRVGAADVLLRPLLAHTLVRKLERALRGRARGTI